MSDNSKTMKLDDTSGPLRSSLPGRDYHSQEIFELERERIFHAKWVCVGREEQLPNPGDFVVRKVIDESVLIVRGRSGELRAFYNVCRHRGSQLCDAASGSFGRFILCPYHAWSYTLDGRLNGTPNVGEVEDFDREDFPLHSIALDTWDGFVFVNLAEKRRPLVEQLGRVASEFARYRVGNLRRGHVIEYDVAANWKIIVENYSECLHCPSVHPELCEIVPLYRRGLVVDCLDDWGSRMSEGATTFTRSGRSSLPGLPGLSDEDRRTYYGSVAFPNLVLNFHSDHVMTYLLEALTPTRTRVVSEFLFTPETIADANFDPSEVVEFWDRIGVQDWEVCERAQRGVMSRSFQFGIYPPQDHFVYDFNQIYLRERDDPA
jgi:Rieske 2Fe-2S family protein